MDSGGNETLFTIFSTAIHTAVVPSLDGWVRMVPVGEERKDPGGDAELLADELARPVNDAVGDTLRQTALLLLN